MAFSIPAAYSKYIDEKTTFLGRFTVKTFTVRPLKGHRGPDDETYQAFPELVAMVPRGFSDLYFEGTFLLSLRGMNKFDGTNTIDEDDFEEVANATESALESKTTVESKSIFPAAKIASWVDNKKLETRFVEKANGKFAIFQLFELEGKLWIFGGSKNMHVVYEFDSANFGSNLHDHIIVAIVADLHKLNSQQIALLIGKTIVSEYVDGMHLVYTKTPYLVYFNAPNGSGLPIAKYVLPTCQRLPTPDELRLVRALTHIEGVVIEYHNTETKEMIRQKHKTEWYIIWRCFREVLSRKAKATSSVSEMVSKLQQRLKVRSDQFLHLSKKSLQSWYKTAEDFVVWMQKTKYDYKDCGPFSSVGMATLLYEFTTGVVHDEPNVDSITAAMGGLSVEAVVPTTDSTAKIDITDYLMDPTMYKSVIAAADFGLPVVVIMSGPSGSGKSTVSRKLIADLDERKINAERFSTDDYFMIDGMYQFDAKKLTMNHLKNLNAFSASKAQVRIVDNTNLARWEYTNYIAEAGKAVCIVLNMRIATANTLAARTTHGVPAASLATMLKKYKPSAPSYYGLFPLVDSIAPTIIDMPVTVSQKTPPHVTVFFVGGAAANNTPPAPELLNEVIDFKVVGYSKSSAGDCLVTECEQLPGNHITLSTLDGFKPVDVGKAIGVSNTTSLASPLTVSAMYLPYF